MPTYEYVCKTCSHHFETWQKMTDEPLTICPECGAPIRRVLFPAGVVFKGSGFYKTDHGNRVVANGKSEDGAKAAGDSTKSETSTSDTSTSSNGNTTKTTENTTVATNSTNKVA